jgi:uncharacterized membrane protein
MMNKIRNTMLTGLVALLPLYLSIVLLVWLFKTLDSLSQPWLARVFQGTARGHVLILTFDQSESGLGS